MGQKLTNRTVDAQKPREKPFEIPDSELKGFLLRVQPSGAMNYYVRYRLPGGAQGRVKIGPTTVFQPAEARDQAKKVLADVYSGNDPAEARKTARQHSLESFLDEEYKPWAERSLKSGHQTCRRLKSAFKPILGKKLGDLNSFLLEGWRKQRLKDGTSVATTNRDIAHLKAALTRAVEWRFVEAHPLARLKLLKEDKSPNVRYLSPDEEKRLNEALDQRDEAARQGRDNANEWRRDRGYDEMQDFRAVRYVDHLRPMIELALNTGIRRGELFDFEWRDVDFARRILTIRGEIAKSRHTRHVPLNSTALETLQYWREQSDGIGRVFKNANGERFDNTKTSWTKLMKDAKINCFRWHDMRHDFASKLVIAGVDLNTVRELLGHSDIKMTLRYSHLSPKVKADAVERIAARKTSQEDAQGELEATA